MEEMHLPSNFLLVFIFIMNWIFTAYGSSDLVVHRGLNETNQNPCLYKKTCGECIQASELCAWCAGQVDQERYHSVYERTWMGSFFRCDDYANIMRTCNPEDIVYPEPKRITHFEHIKEDGSRGSIKSQKIEARAHTTLTSRWSIEYHQENDSSFPLDLYLLVDFSKYIDGDTVSILGSTFAQRLKERNANLHLGFGMLSRMERPQNTSSIFINHLPLSSDLDKFTEQISSADVANSNRTNDMNKNGFHGIIQTILCKETIGWRKSSRKLLLFFTDTELEYERKRSKKATTNGIHCQLDSTQPSYKWNGAENKAYPSLKEIRELIISNEVDIIFAVPNDLVQIFQQLSRRLGASTVNLSISPDEATESIMTEYQNIASQIILRENLEGMNARIQYFSKCPGNQKREKTNQCKGLKNGSKVTFDIKLEVGSCPKDPREWNQTILINAIGGRGAVTTIDLQLICQCDCEVSTSESHDNYMCSYKGQHKCGACYCDEDSFGEECECVGQLEEYTCSPPGSFELCSNRGVCICGECECLRPRNGKIYGKYCECDDFSCDRQDGKLCSDHGRCECGACFCEPEWTGPACQCSTSTKSCISPFNGEICGGNGDCVCGRCKCRNTEVFRYFGEYCEDTTYIHSQCENLRSCVQCFMHTDEYCHDNCAFFPVTVDNLEVVLAKHDDFIPCKFLDENNCTTSFAFKYNGTLKIPLLLVERTENCMSTVWSNVDNILKSVLKLLIG